MRGKDWAIVTLVPVILAGAIALCFGRDLGQWDKVDPAIKQWYSNLKQPDNPNTSCCGEGDAYWADSYEVSPDGNYIAIITDERDDVPLQRVHRPVGLKVEIPKHKLKFDQGNPTGHGIVFLTNGEIPAVLCYLPPGGV